MNTIQKKIFYRLKTVFNKHYDVNQTLENKSDIGSRNNFGTDIYVNGEYFRSLSDNHYFALVDKSYNEENIKEFQPSSRMPSTIDFEKQKLYRLEIVRNKKYFVEANQNIAVSDADIFEIKTQIDNLVIPEFKPLPQMMRL